MTVMILVKTIMVIDDSNDKDNDDNDGVNYD